MNQRNNQFLTNVDMLSSQLSNAIAPGDVKVSLKLSNFKQSGLWRPTNISRKGRSCDDEF